jgi:3-phosphoshikimate 1-carboxyvinyltransferase
VVRVRPGPLSAFELEVPSDPSQAAFLLVAACLVEGSDVVCERVYVGPGRAAYLQVLARMGALVEIEPRDPTTADVVARYRHDGRLRGVEVGGDEVAGLIDEVPVLAVAAAFAEGTSIFRGLGELRVKESDRLATISEALRRVGASVEQPGDDLVIEGGLVTEGGLVDSHGDHRIAMAMAVCGLASRGEVTIEGWDSVATSYPGFLRDLAHLGSGTASRGRAR